MFITTTIKYTAKSSPNSITHNWMHSIHSYVYHVNFYSCQICTANCSIVPLLYKHDQCARFSQVFLLIHLQDYPLYRNIVCLQRRCTSNILNALWEPPFLCIVYMLCLFCWMRLLVYHHIVSFETTVIPIMICHPHLNLDNHTTALTTTKRNSTTTANRSTSHQLASLLIYHIWCIHLHVQ